MSKLYLLLILFMAASAAQSGELAPPPDDLLFNQMNYELSSQSTSSLEDVYVYTPLGIGAETSTALVKITYEKVMFADKSIWSVITATRLQDNLPKPTFKVYEKDTHSMARIIFEPDGDKKYFESIIRKSFHIEKCDDVVATFEYSEKHPFPTGKSSDEKRAVLLKIYPENVALSELLEKHEWSPSCKG